MNAGALDDWLQWLEGVHPQEIDLGLERITQVAHRMGLRQVGAPVITVAGTNGKGSTVACLEAMYRAAGNTPGVYTSPHLLRYNERIRVGGRPVSDALILEAFAAINTARGDITLTYFEFATLAAAWCFRELGVAPWILEVGLGGRLDATNCFDADLAIVTRIDLDHMEWLGDNRDAIAVEKMGIARQGRPVICADPEPPRTIAAVAAQLPAPLWQLGVDYQCLPTDQGWTWQAAEHEYRDLPKPAWLPDNALANAAGAVMAVSGVAPRLRLAESAVRDGLAQAALAGRQQLVPTGAGRWLLDVGHNPSAIGLLADRLRVERRHGKVRMAFALMQRKPLEPLLSQLLPVVDEWFVLDLNDSQAHSPDSVAAMLRAHGGYCLGQGDATAAQQALESANAPGDLMVAAGSFRVVEAFMQLGIGACNDAA